MQIQLLVVGKTVGAWTRDGVETYIKRIERYVRFAIAVIPELKNAKNLRQEQVRTAEGELILTRLEATDHVVLLDQGGAGYGSVDFADRLQRFMNQGVKRLVFVVGGAYGFSDAVYGRANEKLSLSPMTFSHQLVRLVFAEQLYRAFTILNHEPYHHA